MRYLLGIDIGTSGTKTVLFDEEAQIIASATFEYGMSQPQALWAEQNPRDWFDASVNGIKSVLKKSGINADSVAGLGLSGQMHGLVLLDSDNNIIRPSIIWCDQRTGKECEQITQTIGKERLIEITANPALTGFTASKLLWVKNNEPQNYAKIAHVLLPKDYVRFMLTGDYATEVSDASGMQLLDIKNRCWSEEVCSKLGVKLEWLGKMHESCEVTGVISSGAAKLTGLKEGTIVVGGAGDQAASAIGNGIVEEGIISDTIGTSGVVFAHTDKPLIDPQGRVHTFCHAVKNAWHIMGVTQGAGLSLRWFRDEFCVCEKEETKKSGREVYDIMLSPLEKQSEKCASNAAQQGAGQGEQCKSGAGQGEQCKSGAEECQNYGVIFLPYLMGERTPHLDPNAKGVFFGITGQTTKDDMLKAVLEGVAFSQKDCLKIINGLGVKASEIRMAGGGARSKYWRQIFADVLESDICLVNNSEGGALGVAILAGVGAGIYPDVVTAVKKFVSSKSKLSTNKNAYSNYNKKYAKYKSLYNALKNEF